MYVVEFGEDPPAPYVFTHATDALGHPQAHIDFIPPPFLDIIATN